MREEFEAAELSEGVLDTWRRLSDTVPLTPSKLASHRNKRGHMLRHLKALERVGCARRTIGGWVSNQLELSL